MKTQKVHNIKGQVGAKNGYEAIVLGGKMPPSSDQISKRAHEIITAFGGAHRMSLADWLKAEKELKKFSSFTMSKIENRFKLKSDT